MENYLEQCLDSVMNQSIGPGHWELLVVDDGSSDSSGAIADRYAERCEHMHVTHIANSGGPGRPRNLALADARGEFVLFLDADDYLGPETLERLVGMARRADSDIVLAKMVGIDGRAVPQAALRKTVPHATLGSVYSSLSVLKLFRRELLHRLGLRFEEGVAGGEDAPFTMRAYFAARAISVVGDYPCYYVRLRPGSQTTSGWKYARGALTEHLGRLGGRLELVADAAADHPDRDLLMLRHLDDLLRIFKLQWVDLDPETKKATFDQTTELLQRWLSPELHERLAPWHALRAYCLLHGLRPELDDIATVRTRHATRDPLIEGEFIYGRWPHFRDEAQIPDRYFEVGRRMTGVLTLEQLTVTEGILRLEGRAYVKLLGGATTLVLTDCRTGERLELPTEALPTPGLRDKQAAYPTAGFRLQIPLSRVANDRPLGPGPWEVSLVVGKNGVYRTMRIPASAAVVATPKGPLHYSPEGTLRVSHRRRRLSTRLWERAKPRRLGRDAPRKDTKAG